MIKFPVMETAPSCYDCIHARMGSLTFCVLVGESIINETKTARDCPDFERED